MNSEPESVPEVAPRRTVGNVLWWYLMVQAGLFLTLLPIILVLTWVEGGVLAIVLLALTGLLVGPSLQAGMYAVRRPEASRGQHPWSRYWEGWRIGGRQSLIVWAPVVVLLSGVQVLSTQIDPDAIARPLVIVGYIMGGVAAVISIATLSVIANYSFRTRDVPRVALFGMGAKPFGVVGIILLVFVIVWGALIGFEAVVLFLAAPLCWALLVITDPMQQVIRKKLVADPQ